jgi:hypothetical protein
VNRELGGYGRRGIFFVASPSSCLECVSKTRTKPGSPLLLKMFAFRNGSDRLLYIGIGDYSTFQFSLISLQPSGKYMCHHL